MSNWLLLFLLPLLLGVGLAFGVLLQWYRLPGRALRRMSAAVASIRATVSYSSGVSVTLNVRRLQNTHAPNRVSSENWGQPITSHLTVPVSGLALILIDVWAHHPIKAWEKTGNSNIRAKLLPLLKVVRRSGVLVVHGPHGQPIHPLIKPLPSELVLDGRGEQTRLVKTLQQKGIKQLLYAGYASNMCVLTRPIGIIEMFRQGYHPILVRDASLAVEAPGVAEQHLTHVVATQMVERNWGMTTTVDEVIAALGITGTATKGDQ